MSKLAVISGTGLEDMPLLAEAVREDVITPYGTTAVYRRSYQERELVFLPRHGKKHDVPPHLINYRANISALKQLGVDEVIAFFCVGSLRRSLPPGSILLCSQFIDLTWGRENSFSELGRVLHRDMTEPFCTRLQARLLTAARQAEVAVQPDGVYVCTQGPRLETAAEIRAYQSWGGDLVGMTAVPETPLAREAGLCYASVAVVANYGAGLAGSVDVQEISRIMAQNQNNLHKLLHAYLEMPPHKRDCLCANGEEGC